ncbi:MAG: TRAM domain-containing protein, partial [Armatimonadota bacterium]|nr:TRAM domain-containing protein [Armatimonadota bacterium]
MMKGRSFRALLYLFCCLLGGALMYRAAIPALAFLHDRWGFSSTGRSEAASNELFPFAFATVGVLLGFLLGGWLARHLERFKTRVQELTTQEALFGIVGGVIAGVVVAVLMIPLSNSLKTMGGNFFPIFYIAAVIVGGLIGFETFLAFRGELASLLGTRAVEPPETSDVERMKGGKLLDTNVIIDGRVADVRRAGFLQGAIYVPGFVLDELQYIADSADALKRARGRRGLDILNQMQKESEVLARDLDHLIPDNAPVDTKLVSLARCLEADIVTNDYNLNKVAELQGVTVLNLNQLANALKPVVVAGEEMKITVIKEGKEMNQGIGYLDDGTMIVVENARRFVGETLEVVVTSVLQTVAGKMIFATPKMDHDREEELLGRN